MNPSFFQDLLDSMSDGVYFLDSERRITFWSRGAERLTGYRADEVLGHSCSDSLLVHIDGGGRVLCGTPDCPAATAMCGAKSTIKRIYLKHRDGHRIPVATRVKPIFDDDGRITGAAEIFSATADTIANTSRLRQLEEMALVDALTGVGNRRHGEKELRDRLNEAQRYDWSFAVLFVDVDSLKQVNDLHGHDVGDRLLKIVAQTLSHNVRSFDTVIRWGGDEFLVLLKNLTAEHLPATADKLRGLVAGCSMSLGPLQLRVTVSVGATLVRPDDTPETLVRRADKLMYESKQSGGDSVTISPGPSHPRDKPGEERRLPARASLSR